MMRIEALLIAGLVILSGCAGGPHPRNAELVAQVMAAERGFAGTMAERDHAAFVSYLWKEAIFVTDGESLRGREAVAAGWKKYFEGPRAPFSWEPEHVEVLASGTLALSTGPVYDADGRCIATYTSIWRLESAGRWRVVFDRGVDAC